MPDNDIVPRVVRPPYRTVAKLFMGSHEPAVVGDALLKACARELRSADLPALEKSGPALRDAIVFGDESSLNRFMRELRDQGGRSPLVRALADESAVLRETRGSAIAEMDDGRAAQVLVEGALSRMNREAAFGAEDVIKKTLGDSGQTVAELRAHEQRCLDSAQLATVAKKLIEAPSRELRAPFAASRRSTQDMLEDDLR